MKKYAQIIELSKIPSLILGGILCYLFLRFTLNNLLLANIIILTTILVGSIDLLKDTYASLVKKKLALDYIALLAISTGILGQEYLVSAVIVLMLASGQALEKFAVDRARKSLTALNNRIPNSVLLWEKGDIGRKVAIDTVSVGERIFIRKGEVIPLDGIMDSPDGLADESSLTGEPYDIEKIKGDTIRSGTINIGKSMIIQVTRVDKDSTYRKILNMVREAQDERSPLIRIADRYSTIFTLITFLIACFAYVLSHDFHQVLAVLVIATPCPLILATPIALIGGMNALARKKVIVKTLASIEATSRITDIMFDKTGTLTLGKPQVTGIDIKKKQYSQALILGIAEAIERNSLHPLAKAVVAKARSENVKHCMVTQVQEKVGYGISGTYKGKEYTLSKVKGDAGFAMDMRQGSTRIALLYFEDTLKEDTQKILKHFDTKGVRLSIYTGDKKSATEQTLKSLGGMNIYVKTECTPTDKMLGIKALRTQGRVTAMVGDGINDAPALAAADVGMVFSNEEHTAASEAADIIFLGGDFSLVFESLAIAKRTIAIAYQSIFFGIGLSVLGMLAAAYGYIPPLYGALLQEAIDVSVIFNALRASK